MFTITLQKLGTGAIVDITSRLFNNENTILTDEEERSSFERVIGDVQIEVGNMNGFFSSMFSDTVVSTKWEVVVSEPSRVRWIGEIFVPSLKFDLDNESCSFNAFSKTKMFWDRANVVIPNKGSLLPDISAFSPTGYSYLSTFMTYVGNNSGLNDNGTIYVGVDLGDYATRLIRNKASKPAPVGNEGRFSSFDPTMTFKDVLTAMGYYYNAVFYIDPNTRALTMKRRGTARTATATNITNLIVGKPSVDWIDEDQYDYLLGYTALTLSSPGFAGFNAAPQGTVGYQPPGTYYYKVEGFSQDPNLPDTESIFSSSELQVVVPPPGTNQVRQVKLWYPRLPSPCTYLTMCRLDPGQTEYRALHIDGTRENTDAGVAGVFTDQHSPSMITGNHALPYHSNTFDVYRRYNEVTGLWENEIIKVLSTFTPPIGKVFDVRPRLRFEDGFEDPYWTLSFFARDLNSAQFQVQFVDMFRTRRRGHVAVKGTDFMIGDLVRADFLPNDLTPGNDYRVKRPVTNFKKEQTELELVSL